MAKTKAAIMPEKIEITDLETCNQCLGRIASAQASIAEIQALSEDQKQRIDALTMESMQPHVDVISVYEGALLSYLTKNKKKLFPVRKSIDLIFGKVGMRLISRIETTKTTLAKLKKIAGGDAAIIVKEYANKNVLDTWQEVQLARVDAKRIVTEETFYKINSSKPAEKQKNSKRNGK